jgi:hypothetical protein
MGTLHENVFAVMTISGWILLRIRNISNKHCRENNTHFIFSNFFQKLHHLWNTVEKCGGARGATNDIPIWCIHTACWISKNTCTHPCAWALTRTQICNTYCFSTTTTVSRMHLNVTLYYVALLLKTWCKISLNPQPSELKTNNIYQVAKIYVSF